MRGSLRQRSKGSWEIRYDGPSDRPGRRKFLSETVRGTRRDAESVLRERLSAVEKGSYVPKHGETVAEFLKTWLADYCAIGTTQRTQFGYEGYINRYMIPTIGNVPLQKLTSRQIQSIYSEMTKKGLSANTIRQAHAILNEALSHARTWGLLSHNPAEAITRPRVVRNELEMWDLSTIRRFLSLADASRFPYPYRFAVLTGLRRSELVGLQWNQVDIPHGTLRVSRALHRITGHGLVEASTKTKRSRRSLELGSEALAVLQNVRLLQVEQKAIAGDFWQDTGYVFAQEDGTPIPGDKLTWGFSQIVKKNGLPHMTFHGLRHAYATLALTGGVSLKVVSESLGHSSIAITADIYSHLLPGIQRAAAEVVEDQLLRA